MRRWVGGELAAPVNFLLKIQTYAAWIELASKYAILMIGRSLLLNSAKIVSAGADECFYLLLFWMSYLGKSEAVCQVNMPAGPRRICLCAADPVQKYGSRVKRVVCCGRAGAEQRRVGG